MLPAMLFRATLAMVVSSTSMNMGRMTESAMSQGLTDGCQCSCLTSTSSGSITVDAIVLARLSLTSQGMKLEEIADRIAHAGLQSALRNLQIWIQHGIDDEITQDEGDELHCRLAVVRSTHSLRFEVLSEKLLAVLHAREPELSCQIWEVVRLGDDDAIEGQELRRGEEPEHLASDIGQRLARRIAGFDVFDMAGEELGGLRAHDSDKKIGFRGEKRIERLLGGAGTPGDLTGRGTGIAFLEEDRCGCIEDALAFGMIQGRTSARSLPIVLDYRGH